MAVSTRQRDGKFESNLGYRVRPYLQKYIKKCMSSNQYSSTRSPVLFYQEKFYIYTHQGGWWIRPDPVLPFCHLQPVHLCLNNQSRPSLTSKVL